MENGTSFVEVYPIMNPPYLNVYTWEQVELTSLRRWVGRYWKLSIYASVAYVIFIHLCQLWMRKRKPFDLRKLLTTWNVILAAFSFLGFMRTAPEVFHLLKEPNGFYRSVCTRDSHTIVTSAWGYFMILSKLVELGDTVFIVLRKQPLIFLHWYHHITVLVYTWITYEGYDPSLRWFMTMNMFVHANMYTYYALKSLRIKVPRSCAMIITCLQISQMIFGVFINLYSLWIKGNNMACIRRNEMIQLSLLMYASYFALFANFFYKAYIRRNSLQKKLN